MKSTVVFSRLVNISIVAATAEWHLEATCERTTTHIDRYTGVGLLCIVLRWKLDNPFDVPPHLK